MIRRLLIANRGEIANRILRTARRMGIETVAVHSQADARALHVACADRAVAIGPAPARESYLSIDRILDAARSSGADAIHPGYGFLSENPEFAEACEGAGLIFVGPSAAAMRALGSKASAKALMERAGVPTVPGYHGDSADLSRLSREAKRIGFPLLVKASAGGGGRGTRLVETESGLAEALAAATREASAAFGDERMLLEKYLPAARHVEVQIFGDGNGDCVAFPERDCSLQRRRQKVLEETPASRLVPQIRAALRDAAVAAARTVHYSGAGTVEFLVDVEHFYFLEMNTRLQVEHPITEMITGQDLVEWQLRIAGGAPLPAQQEDLIPRGFAMEARICAENPQRDFLPSIGAIARLRWPSDDTDVRVDTGVRAGDVVTQHYDSLLAKLIAWGEDRFAALRRLRRALDETEIVGVETNLDFLHALCAQDWFETSDYDTSTVETKIVDLTGAPLLDEDDSPFVLAAVSAVWLEHEEARARAAATRHGQDVSPWAACDGWRLEGPRAAEIDMVIGGRPQTLRVLPRGAGTFQLHVGARRLEVAFWPQGDSLRIAVDGRQRTVGVVRRDAEFVVVLSGRNHVATLADPLRQAKVADEAGDQLIAPLPARVARVHAENGGAVGAGDSVVTLEVMKTEVVLRAPRGGIVADLASHAGDWVAEGAVIARIAAAQTTSPGTGRGA